jgi:2'-5' RNA ligase
MPIVNRYEDGDAIVLRWGEEGTPHPVRIADDVLKAYQRCVAEGLSHADLIEGDAERVVARDLSFRVGVHKAADGSLCIAWFPFDGDGDENDALATELSGIMGGIVAPGDIHLTILYLGDPGDYDVELVRALVKIESTRWCPLEGQIGGLGRFVIDDMTDCVVALVDCPPLNHFRQCLKDQLLTYGAATGMDCALYNEDHGYVPHLTLGYVPRTQAQPAPLSSIMPFSLDTLCVAAGSDRVEFEMSQLDNYDEAPDMTPFMAARDAYFVAKAGRVLSGKNLSQLKVAHEAMGKVIEKEEQRSKADAIEKVGAEPAVGEGLNYAVTKATDEMRYTLGPLYSPDRKDAHGEWTDPETLHKATIAYVRERFKAGSSRINLQHSDKGDVTVGDMVEVMAWPYEHTVKMTSPGGEERTLDMPAGTVYMGVIWDEDVWPLVKSGKIGGLSLGGRAVRVDAGNLDELPDMGDKLAFSAHGYVSQDSGGGMCKVCKMSKGDGNHVAKATNEPALDARGVLGLAAAVNEQIMKREQSARETERAFLETAQRAAESSMLSAEGDRAALTETLDTLKALATKPEPEVHVHMPEQNVTIHEGPDPLAQLLEE